MQSQNVNEHEIAAAVSKREMAKSISKRVDISASFTIIPQGNGDLILAEIKTNKESGNQYFPTMAVYQKKLSLARDFIHIFVGRSAWVKEITEDADLLREYKAAQKLVLTALSKINQPEVAHA